MFIYLIYSNSRVYFCIRNSVVNSLPNSEATAECTKKFCITLLLSYEVILYVLRNNCSVIQKNLVMV